MVPILTLHNPERARRYYAEGCWRPETFYTLLQRHAEWRPEGFALRDYRRRLTFAELRRWVDAMGAWLHGLGLRPGDRVSVWLPNRVESVAIFLACSRNGYVCNPSLHQNYTVDEIATLLRRLRTRVLIAQRGYGADGGSVDLAERLKDIPGLKRVVQVGPLDNPAATELPGLDAAFAPGPPPSTDPDQVVYIAFTSGTTGDPKGVMHSDNTLLANGRAMVEDWGHSPDSVILSLSPLSHHIATVAIAQALSAGAELAVNAAGPGRTWLDWIEETRATYVLGVPTHAIDLLGQVERSGRKKLGQVKVFYMAGSPIPIETAQRFLKLNVTPQNVYGMTENSSHNYTLPGDTVRTITETCGRPGKGYEIRIFDQANPDLELSQGQVGEIGGKGAVLMLGYWGDQAATESSFNASGWFMSGDLGLLDEQGCLRIVGRKKDLIIRGGHNIHPARIEDLAMRHPGVQKVAAFPVADERLGERVCLAVIPVPGKQVSAPELLEHLHAAGLSKYDMPEFFLVLDAFPLTASGKVLKRELAQWARSGRLHPVPVRWTA